MEQPVIESKLKEFIDQQLMEGQGGDLNSTTPILKLGILDSFSLFQLLNFIEEEFKVKIDLDLVAADQFEDIATIAVLIKNNLTAS